MLKSGGGRRRLLKMVLIKICGIKNAEDALAAVEAGAGALGFNFYGPSPRYVPPQVARGIVEGLPEGVLTVGVFVNVESPAELARLADEAGVAAVQLHGDETTEYCASLRGRRVIKALRVGAGFEPERAAEYGAEAILLDTFSASLRGGTGRSFDWSLARRTRSLVPRLYLAGGLTPENVGRAVREVAPFAVDACSGVESAPGRKSFPLMREFVAAARAAEGEARRAGE
jgi:phosphoribosylanthranilate isomerase